MSKLLKPLVILVLLVAIAALVVQFLLFGQREVVKQRTQKLENGIERVVKTLKDAPLLSDETKGAINFSKAKLAVKDAESLGQIDTQLNTANKAAEIVIQGWDATNDDLEQTRSDLEQTRAELERTKDELDAAKTTIARQSAEIGEKNQQIAALNDTISGLEEEKASLEVQIQDKEDAIAQLEGEKAGLEEEKAMLEAQLEKCSIAQDSSRSLPPGTVGKVVFVNDAWQFVIVDLGANQGAVAGAELMVHRGDQYLGKVRLTAVRENVSVAEIISGKAGQIKENDDVLF